MFRSFLLFSSEKWQLGVDLATENVATVSSPTMVVLLMVPFIGERGSATASN
jgi:hypothetical protein